MLLMISLKIWIISLIQEQEQNLNRRIKNLISQSQIRFSRRKKLMNLKLDRSQNGRNTFKVRSCIRTVIRNTNQMNKLLKQQTVTDQVLQDIDYHYNNLEDQIKIIGNKSKFQFIPFQQDVDAQLYQKLHIKSQRQFWQNLRDYRDMRIRNLNQQIAFICDLEVRKTLIIKYLKGLRI
ncbi:unnamed protein product [Paramecium sonneborni]|uniref:Uncharacterized protein n=1 Tax=Paramecium sonneborni TaxID=65129 RepID=A0A8S1RNM9_9CILI|nr:unnamed protein product [Paramecium sonneborni]